MSNHKMESTPGVRYRGGIKMTTTNQHTDQLLAERNNELEEQLKAERRENTRLRLRIDELEYRNKKYHENLQRFAPGQPTVGDFK